MTPPKLVRTKTCKKCGTEFVIKNTRARFCSRACRERAWRYGHPGYGVEAQRRYLAKPDKLQFRRSYMAEYRSRPAVKRQAEQRRRERYQANPEPVRQRIRARREKYQVGHTPEQWAALIATYGHRCAYCGKKVKRLTRDHIIPISQGDPATVDRIENIVPACKSCNSRKWTRGAPRHQPHLLVGS